MDLSKAFWTAQRSVTMGFCSTTIKLRFETILLAEQPAVFRLCLSFLDEPVSLYISVLNHEDYSRFNICASQFPAIFQKLLLNTQTTVDLVTQYPEKTIVMSLRSAQCQLRFLTTVFRKATVDEMNAHLRTIVHDLRKDRTNVEVELNALKAENLRLRQKLTVVKQTDEMVQKALGQLERKCQDGEDNADKTAEDKDKQEPLVPSLLPSFTTFDNLGHMSDSSSSDLIIGIASYLLCAVCEKVSVPAKCSRELSRHFMQAHADDEKSRCLACPTEANVIDLESHAKSHAQRVYACEFCGKKGRKHYLKSHVRTHTGEKPFKCQSCGRRFADQSTIRRHQTTVHSRDKHYSCPVCQRVISRKDNYRVHLRSHSAKNDKEIPEKPTTETNEDMNNSDDGTEDNDVDVIHE